MPDSVRAEIAREAPPLDAARPARAAGRGRAHLRHLLRRRSIASCACSCPLIDRDGFIWVSWPKKASKVATDITEDVIRAVALPLGLVDIKVCAVDDTWSGLKLVIRKELR